VTDGNSNVAGTATLDITPDNDAPTTGPVTLAPIIEDSGARIITQAELLTNASDIEGDALSATGLIIATGSGSLTNNGDGTWNYSPASNDDTLDITPDNDAPTTTPVALASIVEDSGARTITQTELLANAADVEGDALTATGLSISTGNGSLVDNGDGTWDYTPSANDDTDASFSYTITDGNSNVAGAAMLDIVPDNDTPATAPVTLTSIIEDSGSRTITQAELLANSSDIEGDALVATGLIISTGSGTLVNNGDGSWDFTPASDDDTNVSFTYSVTDGNSNVAGTAILDIIIEGDALTATGLVISAGFGSLVNNGDGTWDYTPASSDDTNVSFSYSVYYCRQRYTCDNSCNTNTYS